MNNCPLPRPPREGTPLYPLPILHPSTPSALGRPRLFFPIFDHSKYLDSTAEMVAYVREDLDAPAGHSREDSWREVACGVDRVTTVGTEGHANGSDDETDAYRRVARRSPSWVFTVRNRRQKQQQQKRAENLRRNVHNCTLSHCTTMRQFSSCFIGAVQNNLYWNQRSIT